MYNVVETRNPSEIRPSWHRRIYTTWQANVFRCDKEVVVYHGVILGLRHKQHASLWKKSEGSNQKQDKSIRAAKIQVPSCLAGWAVHGLIAVAGPCLNRTGLRPVAYEVSFLPFQSDSQQRLSSKIACTVQQPKPQPVEYCLFDLHQ